MASEITSSSDGSACVEYHCLYALQLHHIAPKASSKRVSKYTTLDKRVVDQIVRMPFVVQAGCTVIPGMLQAVYIPIYASEVVIGLPNRCTHLGRRTRYIRICDRLDEIGRADRHHRHDLRNAAGRRRCLGDPRQTVPPATQPDCHRTFRDGHLGHVILDLTNCSAYAISEHYW